MPKTFREWYRIEAKAEDASADVYVFDDIGKSYWDDETVTASKFIADLNALPANVKTIKVHVNCRGGSVFDAHAIANALRSQRDDKGRKVEASIEGLAASAATIITSAANPIRIGDNAMMMIHDPEGVEMGTASAFRKMADALDAIKASIVTVYRWVSNKSAEDLATMMADVTWMDATQAVENGFAHEIIAGIQATNLLPADTLAKLGAIPDKFKAQVEALVAKADPAPPAPPPAGALDVLRVCREGECLDLSESLIAKSATLPQVEDAVRQARETRVAAKARSTAITDLCAHAKLPNLADGYIASAMDTAAVKAHLALIVPLRDSASIDGSLPADGVQAKSGGPSLNSADIYSKRNAKKE